ncbi:toll/interleukin-1 receptor domain-containing protein [Pararobbsia alpina]|uniref:SEFIR domain-containing protein n=1 Tax=Pararobbsia alpina TaxID=621374 RepID=A0A6S7BIL4_9BURK|nr:toll/interleukin-1 receptor domain-containing protein [Pararobbsia alpina]CAB3801428.1 hypothetical protein LMG28138_05012 [Pararobbsia alpina]
MTTSEIYRKPPTAFISYTHEDESHQSWVRRFASDLLFQGVEVKIDQFDLKLGQDLFHFMEKGVAENEFILAICSPRYKAKANNREGGGGYETRIAASILGNNLLTDKFIPILRVGDSASAIPTYLMPALYVDFRNDSQYNVNLERIVSTLFREETKPQIGWPKRELAALFGNTDPAYDPPFFERRAAAQARTVSVLVGADIEELRAGSEVVQINEIDNDRPVFEFDTAVFGFTVPWILNTSDRGVVGGTGPDKITLSRTPGGTVQLEIHRRADGVVAFIGYCNENTCALLRDPGGFSGMTVTLGVMPFESYSMPVSVPVTVIMSYRNRSLPNRTEVVDVRLM